MIDKSMAKRLVTQIKGAMPPDYEAVRLTLDELVVFWRACWDEALVAVPSIRESGAREAMIKAWLAVSKMDGPFEKDAMLEIIKSRIIDPNIGQTDGQAKL